MDNLNQKDTTIKIKDISVERFFIYNNVIHKEILEDMMFLVKINKDILKEEKESIKDITTRFINEIIKIAHDYGLKDNLWQGFLSLIIANSDNTYTKIVEKRGEVLGTINEFFVNDMKILSYLFNYDISLLDEALNVNYMSLITNYKSVSNGNVFNKRISENINTLTKELDDCRDDIERFCAKINEFYKANGAGKFGLYKAFRINEKENSKNIAIIEPITSIEHIKLDDLVGYELQKKKLIENTEAFIKGKQSNNVLLFGDSGTGKSSSVKAILNQYYDDGLRMIEVYKHQFSLLANVIEQIKDSNYKFIIFMDDLSFEEYEIEYKYLKAIIEGGLAKKPDNVLMYATSNRRHLVREKWSDKEERREDLHASDTVEEKLSLVARFGVSIFFVAPNKKEYQKIVETLAKKHGINMPLEELYLEANKWELSHGGISGRMAKQFINHLLSIKKL